MEIDSSAPISVTASIEIAAPPLDVWTVLTDFEGWPRWNPDVLEVRLEGPLEVGTTFRWKAGPGTITSVLKSVDPLHELGWTGVTMGVHAVHVWRLEETLGGTRLTTLESWRGWPTRLRHKRMAETLRQAIGVGLHHLKTEAELHARVAVLRAVA